jgi:hypothetical protein
MRTFHLILLIIAAACFLIALVAPDLGVDNSAEGPGPGLGRRWNLVAAGLLAWVIVPLSVIIEDIADD